MNMQVQGCVQFAHRDKSGALLAGGSSTHRQ